MVAIIDQRGLKRAVEVIQGYIAEKNKWKAGIFMTDYVDLAIKYGGYTSLIVHSSLSSSSSNSSFTRIPWGTGVSRLRLRQVWSTLFRRALPKEESQGRPWIISGLESGIWLIHSSAKLWWTETFIRLNFIREVLWLGHVNEEPVCVFAEHPAEAITLPFYLKSQRSFSALFQFLKRWQQIQSQEGRPRRGH